MDKISLIKLSYNVSCNVLGTVFTYVFSMLSLGHILSCCCQSLHPFTFWYDSTCAWFLNTKGVFAWVLDNHFVG